MADFKTALKVTSRNEGGYANVTGDKGGETYRGIARNFWGYWEGWLIIDRYKLETPLNLLDSKLAQDTTLQEYVDTFFKKNFWDRARLDEVNSQEIANELYDTGVNFAPGRAVRMLQEAINLTRKDLQVTVDGLIGPKTIEAANTHSSPQYLYKMLNVLQGEAYIEIVRRDPTQEKFLKGWFTRVNFLPV